MTSFSFIVVWRLKLEPMINCIRDASINVTTVTALVIVWLWTVNNLLLWESIETSEVVLTSPSPFYSTSWRKRPAWTTRFLVLLKFKSTCDKNKRTLTWVTDLCFPLCQSFVSWTGTPFGVQLVHFLWNLNVWLFKIDLRDRWWVATSWR